MGEAQIIPERLAALDTMSLSQGSHCDFETGHCAMERKPRGGQPTTPSRFWSLVEKTDGCWNWTGRVDEKGYGREQRRARGGARNRRTQGGSGWQLGDHRRVTSRSADLRPVEVLERMCERERAMPNRPAAATARFATASWSDRSPR